MGARYWLDLFTGVTWEEFLKRGADTSGFRERRRKKAQEIKPGDYLICYLTGISRFIGVLRVKSDCFIDKTPIWKDEIFPIRFKVDLIHKLIPETAIPVMDFKEKLSFLRKLKPKQMGRDFLGVRLLNLTRWMLRL